MKKILITIILTGLALLHFTAAAQTVTTSEVDFYSTEIGDNAIIRTDINYGGSMIYYKAQDGTNCFLYRMTNGTTRKFTLPNNKYEIYDMVIGINNYCYFCGSYKMCPTSDLCYIGMIGCMDLSNIASTSCSTNCVTFHLLCITETCKITQMDIAHARGPLQSCYIGTTYLSQYPSCAIFAEWDVNDWSYRVIEVQDPNETLTDIAFSGNGMKVMTVSRFTNDHYKFGLRCEYSSNLFVLPTLPGTPPPPLVLTNFTNRNIVNTYGSYLTSSSNPTLTWHDNNIIARIVCPPESEKFTVAYECVDNTKVCETQRQVAMFQIDVSNFPANSTMSVTKKQIVHGYFEESSTFTDMRYIPSNDSYALLHRSNNSSRGKSSIVQFPSWLAYGQISTLISDVTLNSSIDVRNENNSPYITLIGNNEADNILYFFRQQLNFLESSCYQTRPVSISEELLPYNTVINNDTSTINEITYGLQPGNNHNRDNTPVTCDTSCITTLHQ